MNRAVFGGTFDPPTRNHEAIVRACLNRSDIDSVLLLPSGQRTDKPGMLDNSTRLTMLRLVKAECFQDDPRLIISDLEMRLPQPSYTAQTVAALRQLFPHDRLWFVFGADSYHDMPHWQGGKELQQTLDVLLVPRAGYELPAERKNIKYLMRDLPGAAIGSSSLVRMGIRKGCNVQALLSPGVSKFLETHRCYTAG